MRAPRRPELPTKQRNSLGSGPAGPENFGYFPSLESSPPAGGTTPKTKQRVCRCGGEFLLQRCKRNQKIAGGRGFWERPSANALVFHEPLSPGPPCFTGEPKGCVGTCGRRGALLNGVYLKGGQRPPPNHDPTKWSWFGEEEQGNGATDTRQGVRSEMDFATTTSLPFYSVDEPLTSTG